MTISRSIDESLQVDCKSSAKLKVERVKTTKKLMNTNFTQSPWAIPEVLEPKNHIQENSETFL